MRRVLLFIYLLSITFLPVISLAQDDDDPSLYFEKPVALQVAGLNSVKCVFKDSRHMMWFGTENGLYRYDGVNLNYFKHKDGDTNSLADNYILQIAEDKKGHLWIALVNGISVLNLDNLKIRNYTTTNKRFEHNFTNHIALDGENVWVGNNSGIYQLDKKVDKFKLIWNDKLSNYALSDYVTSLINGDNNQLIATTFHDIVFFNKTDNTFKRVPIFVSPPPKDSSVTISLLDSKHLLWIGTWSGGIYTYDLAKNKLTHIESLQPEKNKMPFYYVTSLYETINGNRRNIWASTSAGLIKCSVDADGKIKGYQLIGYDKNNENSIIPEKLEDIYYDSDGALWCVGDNGACKYFPYRNDFKYFTAGNGLIRDIEQITINADTCLFMPSWSAPNGTGLLITDLSGKAVHQNIKPLFTDKDDGRNISAIAKDKYNRLWISSMAGVSVLDDKFKLIHQCEKKTTGENNLSYYRTNGIIIRNDTVWVICYHRGIDLFDLNFKKLKHYSNNEDGLTDNVIYSFFNDSKNNLWMCGDHCVYRYTPATHSFKQYLLTREANGCSPRDITETKNGDLFVASMQGLIDFNPKTENYTYINSGILEREQHVYSIALDNNNGVWFLTDRHLVHYDSRNNHFILFGQEDGLDVTKGINYIRTFNGTDFYICQDKDVVTFKCNNLYRTVSPPYMVVSMQANDSNVMLDNTADGPALPYNKNKVQFEFNGISYIKASQNQYYYQLSDVDKGLSATYKNSVSYANLAPGSYSFNVKAVNYAGVWSENKIIHFIIAPPYWQTWWFRTLTILSIFSILFLSIRYISQRNLKERILRLEKETAIERERNRIAQDMHDDLGSGLTKIAILSEVVKKQMNQPGKAVEQLERISDSSRNLVDNLQDIIWMLNTKHDQIDSLAIYIREYATKYFEQSGIHVSFEYPAQIAPLKIGEERRRNLYLAIKEALNNIAKHASATAVTIVLIIRDNVVKFIVTDNGSGFKQEEIRQFANGLKNMQNRLKDVGGECSIASEKGKGTSVTFALLL